MILSTAHYKRVSGFATTWFRPNPLARTADTSRPFAAHCEQKLILDNNLEEKEYGKR